MNASFASSTPVATGAVTNPVLQHQPWIGWADYTDPLLEKPRQRRPSLLSRLSSSSWRAQHVPSPRSSLDTTNVTLRRVSADEDKTARQSYGEEERRLSNEPTTSDREEEDCGDDDGPAVLKVGIASDDASSTTSKDTKETCEYENEATCGLAGKSKLTRCNGGAAHADGVYALPADSGVDITADIAAAPVASAVLVTPAILDDNGCDTASKRYMPTYDCGITNAFNDDDDDDADLIVMTMADLDAEKPHKVVPQSSRSRAHPAALALGLRRLMTNSLTMVARGVLLVPRACQWSFNSVSSRSGPRRVQHTTPPLANAIFSDDAANETEDDSAYASEEDRTSATATMRGITSGASTYWQRTMRRQSGGRRPTAAMVVELQDMKAIC
ncbi:hypothetical protein THASP1DRAFT_27882 [Thamnocephalis sphaerospora]|uniref:Uncharacterized protein n=1 Tax=Thamnocephalis sphaerospora TaxID=78915 RepID=A0A4P9XY24_9FUNG|nr:hypothetical protein THASP1DRAFT_27882 [Thamnocephalis sphaerospora]|eukprot:RKP10330.1 hypothetical protein THASP1DRAFT_27882 [Thamnocephalis sphaerospora]